MDGSLCSPVGDAGQDGEGGEGGGVSVGGVGAKAGEGMPRNLGDWVDEI